MLIFRDMEHRLAFDLHVLTERMDRSADRMLTAERGLSYRRFLALLLLDGLGTATQRQLADALGVTEPSVSRMVGVLGDAGLLDVRPDPGGGNRRQLALTPEGERTVETCLRLLEGRFAAVLERSGIDYEEYAEQTRRLLDAFEG